MKMNLAKLLPLCGALFGVIFWFGEAVMHYCVFDIEATFLLALFPQSPEELWMRSFVVGLFICFGFIGTIVVRRLERAKNIIEEKNVQIEKEIKEKKLLEWELRRQANTDFLTGIYSRRHFYERLEAETERASRSRTVFALILCDLDNFKQINDNFGHTAGDRVLQTFSAKILSIIRKSDIFARYGGEEFIILAPDTKVGAAASLAEKIRKEVESLFKLNMFQVTVSIGVTQYKAGDIPDDVIKRADTALYKAKSKGKNTVVK